MICRGGAPDINLQGNRVRYEGKWIFDFERLEQMCTEDHDYLWTGPKRVLGHGGGTSYFVTQDPTGIFPNRYMVNDAHNVMNRINQLQHPFTILCGEVQSCVVRPVVCACSFTETQNYS